MMNLLILLMLREVQLEIGMKIFEVRLHLSLILNIKDVCVFFIEKYDIVGRLLKQGEKASVYPIEESTVDGSNKKNE